MGRGLLFDVAVGASNTALALGLARLLTDARPEEATIRVLVVVAVAAQGLGAALKAPALRRRRAPGPCRSPSAALLGAGLLLNLALLVILLTRSPWLLPLAFVSTAAVAVAAVPSPTSGPAAGSKVAEAAGDLLLWLSATLVLLLFDLHFASLMTWDAPGPHLRDDLPAWLGIAAATVFYCLFFYAPVRLLHLVEDGRRLSTWLQMALAVLPLQLGAAASHARVPFRLSCPPAVVARPGIPATIACRIDAGAHFAGVVALGCEGGGGLPLACAVTPPRLELAAAESAEVVVTLTPPPEALGFEHAVLLVAISGELERDRLVRVRVEP